jgi:ABC-type transport system involved in Fe-S cluster assembly fused permease/ATPase subunit
MISKRKASYMYVAFLLVVLMTTSSAVQKIAELEVIEGNDGANCNKTVKLLLYPDVLQGDAYRDTPCHVVSVCGKQGVMKSTLLRALSIFFGMEKGDFHTSNSDGATTTSVDISDVSRDNHLFLDTIGNEDPSFAMYYGLDSRAIDRAFSQLVAPAANVLIYVSIYTI